MDQTRTGRPPGERPATYVHDDVAVMLPLSHDMSPALAYWRGLQDGARMAREQDVLTDDRAHRAAVQLAQRVIEQADRRRLADAGELAA